MKKTLFLLALACCIPTEGYSQGFMKKLKQKMGNAVDISESTGTAEEAAQASGNDGSGDDGKQTQHPTPSDKLQKQRTATREAYYRKIVSVNLRVQELDKQYSCSDEEMVAFRKEMYASAAKKFGITKAELRSLEDDKTTEAEKERITQKIVNNTVGDISGLEAMGADRRNRLLFIFGHRGQLL